MPVAVGPLSAWIISSPLKYSANRTPTGGLKIIYYDVSELFGRNYGGVHPPWWCAGPIRRWSQLKKTSQVVRKVRLGSFALSELKICIFRSILGGNNIDMTAALGGISAPLSKTPVFNQVDLVINCNMQWSGGHPWVHEANIIPYEGYGEQLWGDMCFRGVVGASETYLCLENSQHTILKRPSYLEDCACNLSKIASWF